MLSHPCFIPIPSFPIIWYNRGTMTKSKRILCRIAVLICFFLVIAVFTPKVLNAQEKDRTVRVGWYESPFNSIDESGRRSGYAYEYQMKISAYSGWEYDYVKGSWTDLMDMLVDGDLDLMSDVSYTEERAEKVDFALPYMNVALGVVSPEGKVIKDLSEIKADEQVIVISGTTAETYLEKNYPDIKLQKFDTYATAKTSFENGTGVAWANDNTEVIAYAIENKGYVVGIPSLGSQDTIAPAVSKGNSTLLEWINSEIESLGKENFFHADYEATLIDTYGKDYEETLVVEGGKVSDGAAAEASSEDSEEASTAATSEAAEAATEASSAK